MNKIFFYTLTTAVIAFGYVGSAEAVVAAARPITGQGTWETTLQARDLDGDIETIEAWYDTVLGITWLADADLAASNSFGVVGINPGGGPNNMTPGAMSKGVADNWIAAMNAYDNNSGYLGVNGWRLPDYVDLPPTVGCNTSGASYSGSDCGYNVDTASGELAHMFFITLGNLAEYDTNGNQRAMGNYGAKNTGNFYNLLFEPYWYGDVSTQDATKSWYFNTHYGLQRRALNTYELVAWAVHDGDIGTALATVPVPAALWLFGAGLLGLVGIARKGSS